MDYKKEDLGKGKLKFKINVPAKEMIGYFNQAYKSLATSVKLPGFREGKAPRSLTERTIGLARILSEALDLAVQENYIKVLQDSKINPLSSPNIVIDKYPNYGSTLNEVKDDFEFEVELEVLPEVELRDYSKVAISKKKQEKVKKEDIDRVVEYFRKQKVKLLDADRPAKKGDRAEIDFEGLLNKVRRDEMTSKNHPLILGEGAMIPGFEDQIVGMKKGEEKVFQITFPKEYRSEEFAGKEAEFKVKLIDLKEIALPELDNNLAKEFGYKSKDEFLEKVKENLQNELELQAKYALQSEAVEKVLPYLKAEVPEILIERETDRMIEDFQAQLKAQGVDFDAYLKSVKKDVKALREDMRPQAEKNVKVGMLLGKIVEQKKIKHDDPESGKKAIEALVVDLTKPKK